MYDEIAQLAEMNTFSEYGYDIRYLAADDKYARPLISSAISVASLKAGISAS